MYCTTGYIDNFEKENPVFIKRAWREALLKGNEIGVHTHRHQHGAQLSLQEWELEIQECMDWLTKPFEPDESSSAPDATKGIGMHPSEIYGFRTPYLEYNDYAFRAVLRNGLLYDCSIEEGFQDDQDGTNFIWPYTLDLRLKGNRCPMTFGTHSDIYSSEFPYLPNSSVEKRQEALKEFIDYALTFPEVRIVSTKDLLNWMMDPSSL